MNSTFKIHHLKFTIYCTSGVFSAKSFAEYEKYQGKDYAQEYRSGQGKIKGEVASPDYEISRQLAQKRNLGA